MAVADPGVCITDSAYGLTTNAISRITNPVRKMIILELVWIIVGVPAVVSIEIHEEIFAKGRWRNAI